MLIRIAFCELADLFGGHVDDKDVEAFIVVKSRHAFACMPAPGRGLLVPSGEARTVTSERSGRAIIKPCLSPCLPEKASHFPSGDQTAPPPRSLSPPRRTNF